MTDIPISDEVRQHVDGHAAGVAPKQSEGAQGGGCPDSGRSLAHPTPQPGDQIHQPGHPLFTSPPDGHPLSSPLRDAPGPAAEPQATSGLPPYADGFTVISVYTRAQAIADGVLADASTGDLTDEARQREDGHAAGVAPEPGAGARRLGCPKIGRDLAQVSAQHFPSVHVAMTATVFALIEQAVASPKHANDCRGVWHDILWMSRVSPVQVWQGGRLFRVIITGTGRKRLHTLKAISHPDETGRPCLTIMLPEED